MTCNACNRTIYDRLMSKTSPDNKIWHSECLKCCECNKILDSRYFETSGKLYCRNDYLAFYGPICMGCNGKITDEQYFFSIKQTISTPDQLHGTPIMQSNSLFFHEKCFECNICSRHLQKGEKYYILDHTARPQGTFMICHDYCAKTQSANNNLQANNNTMLGGDQPLQANPPAPRAKRGRMKQNRPA